MRRSGFTVIELLIVVIILGIVAAIVAPRIDLGRYGVESAMRGAGVTLLAAQRQAVTQQHDVIVQFDLANHALRIHDDRDNDADVDPGERVRVVPLGEQIVFGRGSAPVGAIGAGPVSFTKTIGGMPALVFRRNGSASQFGGFYLTSQRAINSGTHAEDARCVVIEPATGRLSWYRYGPPLWRGEAL
ncbi:MAG: pilus assembly FimT family protein [Gammaproteobacteria bacterium]